MSQHTLAKTAGRGDLTQVVTVRGELDLATADRLYQRGHAALCRGPGLLVLDLTDLIFCDAAGLGAFAHLANEADTAGCRYGLVAPPALVRKLLRITGLDQRLPVFPTIGQARQALDGNHYPIRPAARRKPAPVRRSLRSRPRSPAR